MKRVLDRRLGGLDGLDDPAATEVITGGCRNAPSEAPGAQTTARAKTSVPGRQRPRCNRPERPISPEGSSRNARTPVISTSYGRPTYRRHGRSWTQRPPGWTRPECDWTEEDPSPGNPCRPGRNGDGTVTSPLSWQEGVAQRLAPNETEAALRLLARLLVAAARKRLCGAALRPYAEHQNRLDVASEAKVVSKRR